MKRSVATFGMMLVALIWGLSEGSAGPWEDGMASYNRGDYVPALTVFRSMAKEGNAQAQAVLGTMYRRGQGVARSPARAFVWLTRAAAGGNTKAKAELHDMSQAMTPEEMARAKEMMATCEASNYRTREY